METYEHRVINGLLKAGLQFSTPEELAVVLSRDVEIRVDPSRIRLDDLWPCVWALAAVLERQFAGDVYINGGLDRPLPAPSELGPRVRLGPASRAGVLRIAIGSNVEGAPASLWGDARGEEISIGGVPANSEAAHPIACFALAGYLGFAALATVVGIPPFHEEFAREALSLSIPSAPTGPILPDALSIIGLGQLGQAYISLLYFLDPARKVRVTVLDKDAFELANCSTQILLQADRKWVGCAKADFVASRMRDLGWCALGERVELTWGWQRPSLYPRLTLLGLDNFDARRVVACTDHEWIFEAGVGTSFLQPRVSWHSSAPSTALRDVFPRDIDRAIGEPETEFEWHLSRDTPGGCGWVTFNSISASAPAMGLVASAYLWAEVLRHTSGDNSAVKGTAFVWSALLECSRTRLS